MSTDSASFIGRRQELAALMRLLDDVRNETGRAVLMQGSPGIGKTTLLRVVHARARQCGMSAFFGAVDEFEQKTPFSAISDCLGITVSSDDQRRRDIAEKIREGDRFDPWETDRAKNATEAILGLADELCVAGPVAILLDDLQWADEASLRVFDELGKMAAESPLLLVGAAREFRRGTALVTLKKSCQRRGGGVMALEPLSSDEAAELAKSELGAPPGPVMLSLLDTAQGNPLHLRELLAMLRQRGEIEFSAAMAEVNPTTVPGTLSAVIRSRVNFSTEALQVLRAMAAIGAVESIEEIAAVIGSPVAEVVDVVVETVDAGIVVERDGCLVIRHDLFRRAVYEGLPSSVWAAMQQQVGLALAAGSAPIERVAQHLVLGPPTGRPEVTAWLMEHATQLNQHVPEIAVELFKRAVDRTNSASHRDPLQVHFARALLSCGRSEDAAAQVRALLARSPDPRLAGEARWILANAFIYTRPELTLDEVAQALTSPALPPDERVRLQALGTFAHFAVGNVEQAQETAREVVDSAQRLGQFDALTDALKTMAGVCHTSGELYKSLDFADRALDISRGTGVLGNTAIVLHILRGYSYLELGRMQEARGELNNARSIAESGWSSLLSLCRLFSAQLNFAEGNWDDALAEVHAGPEPGESWEAAPLRSIAVLISLHRDEPIKARAYMADVRRKSHPSFFSPFHEFIVLYAVLDLFATDRKPWRAILSRLPNLRRILTLSPRVPLLWLAPRMVQWAVDTRQPLVARYLIAKLAKLPKNETQHEVSAQMKYCRGLLEEDLEQLVEAGESYDQHPVVLFRGMYREDLAAALAKSGTKASARRALDEALEIYTRLGAKLDIRRAQTRLRALGVRNTSLHPNRPTAGWDSLTDTEHRVAEFVAEGLSNPAIAERLFITRRTVHAHVSNILGKLDIGSRAKLAAIVTERRGQPGAC